MNELEPLIQAAPEDLRRYIRQLEERVRDLEYICRTTSTSAKRASQAAYRERRRERRRK